MHRPNGDAYVYFNTVEDATEAMKSDRKYMGRVMHCYCWKKPKRGISFLGTRYIELYFDSPRHSASNNRPRRSHGSPRRVSPSPVKPRSNHYRRSRSILYLV